MFCHSLRSGAVVGADFGEQWGRLVYLSLATNSPLFIGECSSMMQQMDGLRKALMLMPISMSFLFVSATAVFQESMLQRITTMSLTYVQGTVEGKDPLLSPCLVAYNPTWCCCTAA